MDTDTDDEVIFPIASVLALSSNSTQILEGDSESINSCKNGSERLTSIVSRNPNL